MNALGSSVVSEFLVVKDCCGRYDDLATLCVIVDVSGFLCSICSREESLFLMLVSSSIDDILFLMLEGRPIRRSWSSSCLKNASA